MASLELDAPTFLTVLSEELDVKLGHRRVSPVFGFLARFEIFGEWQLNHT